MLENPLIDSDNCDGCGLCVGVCHSGALAMVNNRVAFTGSQPCDWCAECEAVCPTGAIGCPLELAFRQT